MEDTQVLDDNEVYCLAWGLVSFSACAPATMSEADVEAVVNIMHPTGISSRWEVSLDDFATGQKNGCPCEKDPARRHWLLEC